MVRCYELVNLRAGRDGQHAVHCHPHTISIIGVISNPSQQNTASMKFFSAAILLATATRASSFPSFLRSHRALMNQQCLDETDVYVEDSLMAAAYEAVEGEIEDMATCSDAVLDKSSCQVDFATFDSSEEFVQACQALGGKTVKLDASINCSYATTQIARSEGAMSTLKGFNFMYNNLLDCVSLQCEDASVKDKIDGAIDSTAKDVAKSTGATCAYTVDGFASSAVGEGTSGGAGGVTDIFVKDSSSSQCRSLMTAAIGVPLLALAI
jgi:hypothetical protein